MREKIQCVLLVDDDDICNFLNKKVLNNAAITQNIQVAETAKEALRLLEHPCIENCKNPELIFLDLNMPGLTGWDFIEEYKKIKEKYSKDCVIVVLTTSDNPDDKKKAKEIAEIAEFRNKPLTYEMIREIVDKYFAQ
jgi:CheY-like chemotaxis protein